MTRINRDFVRDREGLPMAFLRRRRMCGADGPISDGAQATGTQAILIPSRDPIVLSLRNEDIIAPAPILAAMEALAAAPAGFLDRPGHISTFPPFQLHDICGLAYRPRRAACISARAS